MKGVLRKGGRYLLALYIVSILHMVVLPKIRCDLSYFCIELDISARVGGYLRAASVMKNEDVHKHTCTSSFPTALDASGGNAAKLSSHCHTAGRTRA